MAKQFSDHDWISAPVVDENNMLLGRITIDDVVDIIREEAEHRSMSRRRPGRGRGPVHARCRARSRRRAIWLGINLLTAFLASSVIGRFEATLEQIVALAVLMPIVASMGGIAGTQVMTLMVRGLALGQVGGANMRALLAKELRVGLLNGAMLGGRGGQSLPTCGSATRRLGLVIAGAMLINLLLAALAGVIVPLLLQRMKIDPALAGSVVVTTVTDVMGFFSFLGLGTLSC